MPEILILSHSALAGIIMVGAEHFSVVKKAK
jgi:hypothetical protein